MTVNKVIEKYKALYLEAETLLKNKLEKFSNDDHIINTICSALPTPPTKQSYEDYNAYLDDTEQHYNIYYDYVFTSFFYDIIRLIKDPTPGDFDIDFSNYESEKYPTKYELQIENEDTIFYYFKTKEDADKFSEESQNLNKETEIFSTNLSKPLLKTCFGDLLFENDEI